MLKEWMIGGIIFAVGGVAGLYLSSLHGDDVVVSLSNEARRAADAKDEEKRKAEELARVAYAQSRDLVAARERAQRAETALASLRKPRTTPGPTAATGQDATVVDPGVDLRVVVDAQDAVIVELREENRQQAMVISTTEARATHLAKALEQSELETSIQQQATKAALEGMQGARNQGRIEGAVAVALLSLLRR